MEKDELMRLLDEPEHEAAFRSLIQKVIVNSDTKTELAGRTADLILANILGSDKALIAPFKKRNRFFDTRMRVAAAILIIIMAGATYWFFQKEPHTNNGTIVSQDLSPILPGTDKALLTMADGKTVVLDSIQTGALAQPENANIQNKEGVLIYNPTAFSTGRTRTEFNTLTTPRGGQYRVVLSDGSQVWLNAASSLRFPIAFTGNTREVELTGEAYFEVAKNRKKSFRVRVKDMQVDVVGTHFNINAYSEEEAIKTSLLEGSVQVTKGFRSHRLQPGEQSILNWEDDTINITTADMDAVVAWKNGLFEFQGADIAAIMRQIARWYDVEIISTAKIHSRRFEGKISRNAQLSDVLQILELSNIKFRIEGKKIIMQ